MNCEFLGAGRGANSRATPFFPARDAQKSQVTPWFSAADALQNGVRETNRFWVTVQILCHVLPLHQLRPYEGAPFGKCQFPWLFPQSIEKGLLTSL